jgi:hypothetical protein
MVAVAAQGPIRADAVPAAAGAAADAAGGKAAREDETREYKSDVRKLEELFKKLNPSAAEFVPLSRRQSQGQGDGGNGGAAHRRLSADAPVFVSPATIDYYAPHHPFHHHHHLPQQQQMHVLQLVGGGRDSSSDGSTNGQPNRRVISLAELPIRVQSDSFPVPLL